MKINNIQKKITLVLILFFFMSNITAASPLIFDNKITLDEKLKNTNLDLLGNQPPDTPDITGPTTGKPGIELSYTIVSTDPEGNDIVYCFDWGDESGAICIGPYPSGEEVIISHTWLENGTYTITVKASDILGEESGIASLRVRISTNRAAQFSRYILLQKLYLLKRNHERIFRFSIIKSKRG